MDKLLLAMKNTQMLPVLDEFKRTNDWQVLNDGWLWIIMVGRAHETA